MSRSARMICPFGHSTRPGQSHCPVCGERLIDERRQVHKDVEAERRKMQPIESVMTEPHSDTISDLGVEGGVDAPNEDLDNETENDGKTEL